MSISRSNSQTMMVILIVTLLFVEIPLRYWWASEPSLGRCIGFWIPVLIMSILFLTNSDGLGRIAWLMMTIGFVLNAIVTIGNGGHMPVLGNVGSCCIWTQINSTTRFVPLADIYLWQTSVGDWWLSVGIAIYSVYFLTDKGHGDLRVTIQKAEARP